MPDVDVTIDTFDEALARLRALLPTADFVSIDLEFTGLDQDAFGDPAAPEPPPADGMPADVSAPGHGAAGGKAPAAAVDESAPPTAPFDIGQEAQNKYAKMCAATKFLVVQVALSRDSCARVCSG